MSFKEFQNRARLFVIGALEPEELPEFDKARLMEMVKNRQAH